MLMSLNIRWIGIVWKMEALMYIIDLRSIGFHSRPISGHSILERCFELKTLLLEHKFTHLMVFTWSLDIKSFVLFLK